MHYFENTALFILYVIFFLLALSRYASAEISLQLVSVQMKLAVRDYDSLKTFQAKMKQLMEKITDRRNPRFPALVVFPEDVGLLLIALENKDTLTGVQTIEEAIKKMTMKYFFPTFWNRMKYHISWVPALYFYLHQSIAETYFHTFSMLAEEYQVYLVAGTVALPHYHIEQDRLLSIKEPLGPEIYNTSYFFSPDGKVIGYQDKVHLLELEQEQGLHLTPGNLKDIKVFDTDIGKIGIAICLDAFKEEVIDRLRKQHADILIQPSANPKPWDKEQQVEWLESSYRFTHQQKYFKYGINSMMTGTLLNLDFYGQSSIITRDEINLVRNYKALQPQKGFLAISHSDNEEEVLLAEVTL